MLALSFGGHCDGLQQPSSQTPPQPTILLRVSSTQTGRYSFSMTLARLGQNITDMHVLSHLFWAFIDRPPSRN